MQFIGIEIGINGTHAVVLDLDSAEILSEAFVSHTWIDGLPPGYREQHPTTWIENTDKVVRECLAHANVDKKQIAAIGVAGPQRGLVVLDEKNRIVRPTKLAGDLSARKQEEEISRAFGGSPGLLELIGQSPGIDSAAAECLWLKQHEPYHYQRVSTLLSVQDFIAYWLTGECATEPGSASTTGLFDIRQRKWSGEIINFIDPQLGDLLPPISASDQPRGTLRSDLAKNWGISELVQVGAGSGSTQLATLAAGCVGNGSVALELGSRGTLVGVGTEPVIDLRDEIVPLCSASGSWIGMASSPNTSLAPEVLKRHYGWSAADFERMVASVSPGADGLLLLPYFAPESIPRLLEGCGVLHGITPGNFTPAHLARATAEGVVLGMSYAMSRLREMGFDPTEIRLLGTGSGSPVMRQLLADALGTTVVPVYSKQGAAVGAAMQAAVAFFKQCGESLDFEDICNYLVAGNVIERCEPNPENHELYQDLMARQQYLVDTLHPSGFL
ncbi:MAG: xylulokinase [Verrucomicrobia bacterium]|jgi:xylulokinase|nr:xylulokinase [Verrucomicrobiota bacterium]|tara:strand:- start:6468 stop:7967 length:1500 start_codon:yes stop_codon:yes gene_type:complete